MSIVQNLPIQKFSFDKVNLDTLTYVARAFKFKITSIGKSRFKLYREDVHLLGYQGTIKECYAYLMGYQASR